MYTYIYTDTNPITLPCSLARAGNEVHPTQKEHGNPEDRYAVSILKDDLIVVHIPKELSRICWHFIARDGEITCMITGQRQRSALLQDGLEIYPVYTLSNGKSSSINYEQIEVNNKQAKEKKSHDILLNHVMIDYI